ncbi:MAG: dinitrogenase iron-molybdenum cofactor biosynthesis protein [Sulfurospirillaceae bacterium]|jgi:predicted Fe-Mo cluster-binding NifX family protein|nr:dinitrogenase iron-molybdenum cofactor biosynthesis protein [Sulfurospirillaceae bacterium]MCK9546081.1 dinitrogenase iron-molybdenum cofactor biosynthesis protein [Sulfurospirillaceae bacterium]MDY0237274.1 NifB/NifX family molybdenum-iron cluster-binding protein [Campylobacterales bacterium]
MRLIFPTNENQGTLSLRGAHFGKAKFYTLVEIKEGKIVDVEGIENPGHKEGGCQNAVLNIMSFNPDALIVSGIGGAPAAGFAKAGLDLYFDQESKTVKDSIELFLNGSLAKSKGEGTCGAH